MMNLLTIILLLIAISSPEIVKFTRKKYFKYLDEKAENNG